MSFVIFGFPTGPLSGPMIDPQGEIVYHLNTEHSTFSTKPTKIQRANGIPVGELAWGGKTHKEQVTLNGKTYGENQLMQLKGNKWSFKDDAGREFTWDSDGLTLREPSGLVVARYTRAKDHTFKNQDPASLEVNSAHLYLLDMILFTALWLEKRATKKATEESILNVVMYSQLSQAATGSGS